MKRVFRIKDAYGGYIEVHVLKHNNEVPEDLIWLHFKKGDGEENGWCMSTGEAILISEGLLSAVNTLKTYIIPKI